MARTSILVLRVVVSTALVTWAAAAPLVWILRDGLGPGMVETGGLHAASKFAVGWGLPALVLAALLYGVTLAGRRLDVSG